MRLDVETLKTILSIGGMISAAVLGWAARARAVKMDVAKDAGRDAALAADIAYIKRGIEDTRVDIRMQGERYEALAERVTRIEESAKQAHHRLNRLENGKE